MTANAKDPVEAVSAALMELSWHVPKTEELANSHARSLVAFATTVRNDPSVHRRMPETMEPSINALAGLRRSAKRLADKIHDLDLVAHYALLNVDTRVHGDENAMSSERMAHLEALLRDLERWSADAEAEVPDIHSSADSSRANLEAITILNQVAALYTTLTAQKPNRSIVRLDDDGENGIKEVSNHPFTVCLDAILKALNIKASADYLTRQWLDGERD